MKRISIALLWAAVAGCSQAINFKLPADEVLTLTVSANGSPGGECTIAPDDELHKKLSTWLVQNTDGWKSTPASYMPGLVVKGTGFSLNYLNGLAILNYEGGQYSRKVQAEEYQYLNCDERT